jgi:alkylation response protein AidB-like acyl-CoA dehydrogenase
MHAGTEAQKRQHLGPIARGEVFWCQGFSEPDADSDLASLRTSAVRDGDEYVVNGSKIWTSHTPLADYCFLLVRTNPQAERHHGISILLVPTSTPSFEVRLIPNFVEPHAFAECFFTDMRVPVSCRLCPEDEGWAAIPTALQYERVGAPKYARAPLVLDRVAEWARREGKLNDGELLRRLGEARAICEAARLIAYRVIDERARQRPLARCVSRTCRHGPGGARCRQPRPRGPGQRSSHASAASSYVRLVDDAAESFVVGVVVAPDDVPADHAGLLLVTGVVGPVEREVPQRRELRLYAV